MHNLPRQPIPATPAAPPGSLAAALATLPDPRRPFDWHPDRAPLPRAGMLQVSLAAILCGARSLYAIAQWARERVEDEPTCLVALGLPPGRHPSVATLHRVFQALDVAALERIVAEWLAVAGAATTTSLALDGCPLGDDAARQPRRWRSRRAPGRGLRPAGAGGAGAGGDGRTGARTGGGQAPADPGAAGGAAGDRGRLADPAGGLPVDSGRGRG